MEIEFDAAKDAQNRVLRGLPFALAALVLSNLVGEMEDTRSDYGERRFRAFGWAADRLLCCVYTRRGDALRIISLRAANRQERAEWLR